jgi:hypothetical protein
MTSLSLKWRFKIWKTIISNTFPCNFEVLPHLSYCIFLLQPGSERIDGWVRFTEYCRDLYARNNVLAFLACSKCTDPVHFEAIPHRVGPTRSRLCPQHGPTPHRRLNVGSFLQRGSCHPYRQITRLSIGCPWAGPMEPHAFHITSQFCTTVGRSCSNQHTCAIGCLELLRGGHFYMCFCCSSIQKGRKALFLHHQIS